MSTMPQCDADCARAGWIESMAECGERELHISHAPDADLGGQVWVFDHDEQRMRVLNGWLWIFYPVEGDS